MAISTVRLVNAVFFAHHGVMQEEHRLGGRFEVDVSMDLDVTQAAESDDLSYTVDYERIYRLVKDVVLHNRFYLIERLAYLIARDVMDAYPELASIEVTVRKPNPPVGGTADRAEVVYRTNRSA
ncbi:MAG TPA: dihydroneopterin aldolase [Rhodothermales bacterium]|nr:dihydroneopterin aldolase [Rhodothermales bacterium]